MMHVLVISDEHVYLATHKSAQSSKSVTSFDEEQHVLGFKFFKCVHKDSSKALGFLLVPPNEQIIFQALQRIHKTWQVSDFVVFDVLRVLDADLMSGFDFRMSIPKCCLRSAGSGDLQTGPLLFEKLNFSESLQFSMVETFQSQSDLFVDSSLNLFSGFGLDHEPHFEKTIYEQSKCFAWDICTGEILQTGRRLAVKIGALFVLTPRSEFRLGALDLFLKTNSEKLFLPLR